jgi:hypothetical protein
VGVSPDLEGLIFAKDVGFTKNEQLEGYSRKRGKPVTRFIFNSARADVCKMVRGVGGLQPHFQGVYRRSTVG